MAFAPVPRALTPRLDARARASSLPSPSRPRPRVTARASNEHDAAPEVPFGDTAGAAVVFSPDVRVTTGANDLILGAHDGETPVRIEPSEICGLVGANGAGKSTLVKCLSGRRDVSDGYARVARGAAVGVLEQTAVSGSTMTVEEEAMSRMTHVMAAREAMEEATEAMASGDEGAARRLADAREAYDAVGGATAKKRASTVLKGLGFSDAMMGVRCDTLSGGWQMRVALARLLLSPAGDSRARGVAGGVLLLDEPSNHLDSTSRDWLVRWIKSYPGTVVLVSHDEELLACVDRVVELRGRKLHNFKGDYARFLREREARRAAAVAALEREGAKAAKLEGFIKKFGAKATKASAAKSKQKALDKVNAKMDDYRDSVGPGALGDGPGDAKKVTLKLPTPPKGAREIVKLKDVAVGYASTDSVLVSGVTVTVSKGDRLLVLGPNGAGKSTFLKTVGGVLDPVDGVVERGEGAVIGYFSQDLAQELPADVDALTHVLDVARRVDKTVESERARSVLGALGITGSAAVDRTIGSLSGGEKARVALAAFVLRPVNVLLLDEASNHLDGAAVEALCEGLREWEGAVCAVTHNSAFAAALRPTAVARVENGSLSYETRVGGHLGVGERATNDDDTTTTRDESPDAPNATENAEQMAEEEARTRRRALEKEAANAPKIIDKIERALAVLETDIDAIDAQLFDAGADVARATALQREKDEKLAKHNLYMAEWERLETVVAQVSA
jgi:ATP-binding cassette subfamily F protein 3